MSRRRFAATTVSRSARSRHRIRGLIAGTASVLLAFGGAALVAAPAYAAPGDDPTPPSFSITPDTGTTAGGTEVTVTPPDGVTFVSVSAGYDHSLAVGSDGKAYAWGSDSYGQLGDGGTNTNQPAPVEVQAPVGVTFTSVSAGYDHSLAVGSDGKAYAWGADFDGSLGDGGANTNQSAPVEVLLPTGVESVSAGLSFSLAVGSDGKTYAWGSDFQGKLGDGEPQASQSAPVEVVLPAGVTFVSVSAGYDHSLAVGSNGKAYAWGSDSYGKLGDSEPKADQSAPVEVLLPNGVTTVGVSARDDNSLAVDSDGKAYAWGSDVRGQLGDGVTLADHSTPVEVLLPAGVTFVSVSAGNYHSLAVGSDGKAYAWGWDGHGQLGDGETLADHPTPVEVQLPAGVAFVSLLAGSYHSLAVGSDGKTYAWGFDSAGQLGDGGENTSRSVPTPVSTPEVVVTSVTFGGAAGTDLTQDGDVWKVSTPAYAAGAVEVVLGWTLGGVAQASLTLTDGFTFIIPAPAPPTDVTVSGGLLQAHVSWERSADDVGLGSVSYSATIVQGADTFTCTTTGMFCVVTGLAAGAVTASVVATDPGGSSSPATGSGTVLARADVPAAPPADQGGVSLELRDQAGQAVTEVLPGQTLTAVVTGFAPHSLVDVFAYSTPQHLGTGLTDGAGSVAFAVTVPSGLAAGAHAFMAIGLNRGGATATASVAVSVSALAVTGSDVDGLLAVGGLFLAAGLAVVLSSRRRPAA